MKARRGRHLQPPSPHFVHSLTVSTGHPYCFLVHLLWPSPSSSPFITLHVSHLDTHKLCEANWGLSACWMLIPKISPEQQMRKWDFSARDQIPLRGETVRGGQDSAMRGKGHSTGVEWTVTWCPHEVGLTQTCLSHSGLYRFRGSTSTCRFGAWTSSRPSVVRKEILTCESNSPDCCKPFSFPLPPSVQL